MHQSYYGLYKNDFFWRGNTFAHPPKCTFVKSGSPSLTRGMEGKVRSGFMISVPFWRVKRLDMTTRRSEVFFTGRKRLRGTLTPVGIEINNLSFFPLSLSVSYLLLHGSSLWQHQQLSPTGSHLYHHSMSATWRDASGVNSPVLHAYLADEI